MNKAIVIVLFLFVASVCYGQSKRAFLVGISEYTYEAALDNAWTNIHGANDVSLISMSLKKQGFTLNQLTDKECTAFNIRKQLKNFTKHIRKGDIVYIHFSCHGQPYEDIDGDEDDGWDESLVPIDAQMIYSETNYKGQNHIIDDDLNVFLNDIRVRAGNNGTVYLVIDACHAGSSYRGNDDACDSLIIRGTDRGFSSIGKDYTPRIDRRSSLRVDHYSNMADICVIEACRSYQVNSEIKQNGKYYGSLSWYINDVISRYTIGKDFSWVKSVRDEMDKDIRLVRQNMVIESSKTL